MQGLQLLIKDNFMRPEGINDFDVMRAIRYIPTNLVTHHCEVAILKFILESSGNNQHCWYAIDQIASILRYSRSSIQRHTRSLIKKNLLFVKYPEKQGRGTANIYSVNYELILTLGFPNKKPVDNCEKRVSERPPSEEKGVRETPERGSERPPKKAIQESKKEKKEKPSFFSGFEKRKANPKQELKSTIPWRQQETYSPNAEKPSPLLEPEPRFRVVKFKEIPEPLRKILAVIVKTSIKKEEPQRGLKEKEALETLRKRLYGQ